MAEAMIRLALADDPPRLVEIGGPEAISRDEAAAAFAEAAGHPLHVRHIPRPMLEAGWRLLGGVRPVSAMIMGMMVAMDRSDTPARDAPLLALGIQPKPVSRYIREAVGAAG